ncbi:MAG TPA: DUF4350 domain-containing protein [Candidatus Dormibacteraeota bacterium]|nr:DUF4350 domain-containing protein [Candidatus Dormibacteraeota bacterium]
MRVSRGWVIAAIVAIVIAGVLYLLQPRSDSPEHSTNSDAANGASAALLFAQAMGHPTSQITGSFNAPEGRGALFVFTPTSSFTSDEAGRTLSFVEGGGLLVYAAEEGDQALDQALGVVRLGGYVFTDGETANPVVDGVARLSGAGQVMPLDPKPDQVPFMRAGRGFVTGYIQRIGAGTVVVIADPLLLCNGYLDKADNGRLLADLLGLAGSDAAVQFDEYHHGLAASDLAPQPWVTTPWGAALLWLLVAVFVGLLLRGRRFGPLVERPAERERSDVEWSVAVGQLLRRAGARVETLGLLASATERAVAARNGLTVQPRERFWNALWVRAPQDAADLARVEDSMHAASASDGGLLEAAQQLHRIAHPVTRKKK